MKLKYKKQIQKEQLLTIEGDGEDNLWEDDADVEQELRNFWSVQTGTVRDSLEQLMLNTDQELKRIKEITRRKKKKKKILIYKW